MLTAALAAFSGPASAQQTNAYVQELGRTVQFSYAWKDHDQRPQSLNFSLPLDDLQRGDREFKPFDDTAANAYAFQKVKERAATYRAQGMDISVVKTFSGYRIEGNAPVNVDMNSILADLHGTRDQGLDDYIHAMFYTRMQGENIMPDHKRIARRYAPALRPMLEAMAQQTPALSIRERSDWLLGFLQTIPYDQLLDRYTTNGSGFNTPYGLLRRNRGDCDTKAVAMLAALRGLYPNLPLTMVYVPEHAFVGIGIAQGPGDYALRLGGRTFVLADPTGPRLLKVGEVDIRALSALSAGKFSFQEVPF